MKKLLFGLSVFCLLLTACGGEKRATDTAPPDDISTSDAAQAVVDYLGWEDLSPLEQEERDLYLNELYSLEEGTWTEATIYAAQGTDARELAVIRLSDPENDVTVANAVEEYRQNRRGDFYGYFPAQAALVEKGITVIVPPCYVALFICDDPDGAVNALMAVLDGEEPPTLALTPTPAVETASPTPTPTPVPTPRSSPTPTHIPVPSPTSESEPTPTPEAEPTSTLDISKCTPFDPPNDFDMTLYDTSAILAAYASGDESGLRMRDQLILERCKEGLEACVTEDMTDFEKELALHDWMIQQGEYDEAVHDRRTPQGQPNNTNPYGYLVRGYGICLGYATSFQLLMDLAGVECITVVGAANGSRDDHAWNMVKLEGEWYCVDSAWNAGGGHTYFNVTSEYMRQSDHQWDYENVPEATATRFYWNGYGKMPE